MLKQPSEWSAQEIAQALRSPEAKAIRQRLAQCPPQLLRQAAAAAQAGDYVKALELLKQSGAGKDGESHG